MMMILMMIIQWVVKNILIGLLLSHGFILYLSYVSVK